LISHMSSASLLTGSADPSGWLATLLQKVSKSSFHRQNGV
jgi:hypothetical protein